MIHNSYCETSLKEEIYKFVKYFITRSYKGSRTLKSICYTIEYSEELIYQYLNAAEFYVSKKEKHGIEDRKARCFLFRDS